MKKHIIVINGTGGCGKDTFVDFVAKYKKVFNFSSIDKVKELALAAGWDGEKTEKARKFLADLKQLTTEFNDMAFKSIENAIEEFDDSENEIMFIHIREPEEIDRIVQKYNAKALLIKRIGQKNILSNSSDADVNNYDYHFIIENKTLEELEKQAIHFIDELT